MEQSNFTPCLFCKIADAVALVPCVGAPFDARPGYVVACATCGLRGPWRSTEASACHAWNRLVIVEMDIES